MLYESIADIVRATAPHFKPGSTQRIFTIPLQLREYEGRATLLRCLRTHAEFDHPGLVIELWVVRFTEAEEPCCRIVCAPC